MPDEPVVPVLDALRWEPNVSNVPDEPIVLVLDVSNESDSPVDNEDTFDDTTLPCFGRVGNASKVHVFGSSTVQTDTIPYCRDKPFRWQPSEIGYGALSGFSLCDACLRSCPLRRARAVRAYAVC